VKGTLFRVSSTERGRLFEQIAGELAQQPGGVFAYALVSSQRNSITDASTRSSSTIFRICAPSSLRSWPCWRNPPGRRLEDFNDPAERADYDRRFCLTDQAGVRRMIAADRNTLSRM
jgi:hypothetical protein